VEPALEGRAHVTDRGLARARLEGRDLDHHVGRSAAHQLQRAGDGGTAVKARERAPRLDPPAAGAEGQARGVDREAVVSRRDGRDADAPAGGAQNPAVSAPEPLREAPADAAEADQREP
jgi:hypothetical protein